MAVIKIPEKAILNPNKDGFNSVKVAIPTPANIIPIGIRRESSVLIPKSKNCKSAIVGATNIYKVFNQKQFTFKLLDKMFLNCIEDSNLLKQHKNRKKLITVILLKC